MVADMRKHPLKLIGIILTAIVHMITFAYVGALLIPMCLYILTLSPYTVDYSIAILFAAVIVFFFALSVQYLWKWRQGYGGEFHNSVAFRNLSVKVSKSKAVSAGKRRLLLAYGGFIFLLSLIYLCVFIYKLIDRLNI